MRKLNLVVLVVCLLSVAPRSLAACSVSINATLSDNGDTITGTASVGGSDCYIPSSTVDVIAINANGHWDGGYVARGNCGFPNYAASCTANFSFSTVCWPRGPVTLRAFAECFTAVDPNTCRSERVEATQVVQLDNTLPSISITANRPDADGAFDGTVTWNFPHDNGVGHWEVWEPTPQGWSYGQPVITGTSGSFDFHIGTSCWPAGTYTYKVRYTTCYGVAVEEELSLSVPSHQPTVHVTLDSSNPNDIIATVGWSFPNNAMNGGNAVWLDWFPLGSRVWQTGVSVPKEGTSGPIHLGACDVDRRKVVAAALACDDWVNGYAEDLADLPACDPQCMSCPIKGETWTDPRVFVDSLGNRSPISSPECPGDPIKVTNGNMRMSDVDALPGGLGRLRRTYDSIRDTGLFGRGWASLFDAKLRTYGRYVVITDETGGDTVFKESASLYTQVWPFVGEATDWLTFDAQTNVYLYRPDGQSLTRVFSNGRLIELRPIREMNPIAITYGADGVPTRVADTLGTFGWTITGAGGRIGSIVADGTSFSWTYVRDGGGYLTAIQTPLGPWRTYEYDAGRMTAARDGAGNLIESHEYDGAAGRATTSSGPSGEITAIIYGAAGRIAGETVTTVLYGSGRSTTFYTREIAKRLRTVEVNGSCDCGGEDAVYVHDGRGRVIREQNALGYIINRAYANDRVIGETSYLRPAGCDPENDVSHCKLDPDGLAVATLENTELTRTVTYAYGDANWPDQPTEIRAASVLEPEGSVTRVVTYDVQTGRTLTDTLSGVTGTPAHSEAHTSVSTLYDGTEAAVFSPHTDFAWAALPQPRGYVKQVDGPRTDVQDVAQYVYYPTDPAVPARLRGRLAGQKNAAGQTVFYADYDLFGNVTRVLDANGTVTETQHDALGRLTTSVVRGAFCDPNTDPSCESTTTRSHAATGPVTMEATVAGVTVYTYDGRGRTASIARGAAANDLRERIVYTYDIATGKKSSEATQANENGTWVERRREEFVYDTNEHLSLVRHGDSTSVGYTYGTGARLIATRDERHDANNTFYEYSGNGRLSAVHQQLGAGTITTGYAYDAAGNLVGVTDPNGNVTSYLYDDFGRMLRQVSPVSGTTLYAYDAAGQLVSTVDANGATSTRVYDALGRVITSEATRGGPTETVTWTYDTAPNGIGRIAAMNDPTGSTAYEYDHRGLLTKEAKTIGGQTFTTGFRHDAMGNRSEIHYPSGRIASYGYDFSNRPVSLTSGGATIVASAEYQPFGPLSKLVYGNGTIKTVTFDTRYRPLTNTLSSANGAIAQYGYHYDAGGNVTAIEDQLNPGYDRTFGYDELSRLTMANSGSFLWGSGAYTYDAMGNLLSSQVGTKVATFNYAGPLPKLLSVTEDGVTRTITYDSAGNETRAGATVSTYSPRNHLQSAHDRSYEYDGRGIRTATVLPAPQIAAFTIAPTTIYTNQTAIGTVTLAEPAPASGAIVILSTNDGAVSVPPQITIAAGNVTGLFNVTDQTGAAATISITAAYGTTRLHTSVTTASGPALQSVTVTPNSVTGGTGAMAHVVLAGSAPTGGAPLTLSASGSASIASTAAVPAGDTTIDIPVTTGPVSTTSTETVTVTYGNSVQTSIEVHPPVLTDISITPEMIIGGRAAMAVVTLSGPAPTGGITVAVNASGPVTVPSAITISDGQTSASFIVNTAVQTASVTATITVSLQNVTATDTLQVVPCSQVALAPPVIPSSDRVLIDDAIPSGAILENLGNGPVHWDATQKASGQYSLAHSKLGDVKYDSRISYLSVPLQIGERFTFYMLINECAIPKQIRFELMTSSTFATFSWGDTSYFGAGNVEMGPIPQAGAWHRIEVSLKSLGVEKQTLKHIRIQQFGGQVWFDSFATSGDVCLAPHASPPTVPSSDRLFIDDTLPAGASLQQGYRLMHWDTEQNASGTKALVNDYVGAIKYQTQIIGLAQPLKIGENLVFYMFINPCAIPTTIRLDLWTGVIGGALLWGDAAPFGSGLNMGPIPGVGVWHRIEIPLSALRIDRQTLSRITVQHYGGQVWFDGFGTSGTACEEPVGAQPTLPASDRVFIDDTLPAGATISNSNMFWDTFQAASGQKSLAFTYVGPSRYESLITGLSEPLLFNEKVGFYLYVNPCAPPTAIRVDLWTGVRGAALLWGDAAPFGGGLNMGAIPQGGIWHRVEVPLRTLQLENLNLIRMTIQHYAGQVWFDRFSRSGDGCTQAPVQTPQLPSSDAVFIDDAATIQNESGSMSWKSSQHVSGTAALESAFSGDHLARSVSTLTNLNQPLQSGDNLVLYVLFNACTPPREVRIGYGTATAGKRAYWGDAVLGGEASSVNMGGMPAAGVWQRLEIPVDTLNLAGGTLNRIELGVAEGQVWFDHFAISRANAPAVITGFTASHTSPQAAGSAITWTATASGAVQPLEYRFERETGGTWTEVQAYSATSTYTWTADTAGDYTIRVSVRNGGSLATFDDTASLPMTIEASSDRSPNSSSTFVDRLRTLWRGEERIPVTLGISFRPAEATSLTPQHRYSLYSPELNLLAETATTSATTSNIEYEYLWFAGQPVAQIQTATGAVEYYFNDHLGTPILQTANTGAVTWQAEYDPYGTPFTLRTGAEKHQPLRFPGQENDGTQEESYNIFRWYRSGWGRYTQGDPAGLDGGINVYGYAYANPVSNIDPLGLAPVAKCCVGFSSTLPGREIGGVGVTLKHKFGGGPANTLRFGIDCPPDIPILKQVDLESDGPKPESPKEHPFPNGWDRKWKMVWPPNKYEIDVSVPTRTWLFDRPSLKRVRVSVACCNF